MSDDTTGVVVELDGLCFRLRERQNFDWVRALGRVFAVFDEQDSGNLSFGVEKSGRKRFLKYAGARPVEYTGCPSDAVARLREAIPVYQDLRHPDLIELEDHFETANGYAAVFDWFEGECLHSHWLFRPGAGKHDPNGPYCRYRGLPVDERLQSLFRVFCFHTFVEDQSYVAIDLFDGSILYDFQNRITKVCDVDWYKKKPVINHLGASFGGSDRFKSPEEYERDASIDARTNVYTLGALAFWLLGGEMDHSRDKWEAGDGHYRAACRATEQDRSRRYATVREFVDDWQRSG